MVFHLNKFQHCARKVQHRFSNLAWSWKRKRSTRSKWWRMKRRRTRSRRKTRGPLSQRTSKRKASFVNSSIPSTSSSRTPCRKSSTSLLTLKFDPSLSTIPATNPIPQRCFSSPSFSFLFCSIMHCLLGGKHPCTSF